jgi:hypothetical protein
MKSLDAESLSIYFFCAHVDVSPDNFGVVMMNRAVAFVLLSGKFGSSHHSLLVLISAKRI